MLPISQVQKQMTHYDYIETYVIFMFSELFPIFKQFPFPFLSGVFQ